MVTVAIGGTVNFTPSLQGGILVRQLSQLFYEHFCQVTVGRKVYYGKDLCNTMDCGESYYIYKKGENIY